MAGIHLLDRTIGSEYPSLPRTPTSASLNKFPISTARRGEHL